MRTTVTVIIPARNAGPCFGASLISLAEQFAVYPCYDVHYIIVGAPNAYSSTAAAERFARFRSAVTVVQQDNRDGIVCALQGASERANSEYTIVVDAKFNYTADAVMTLLESIERERADMAVASPYLRGGEHAALSATARACYLSVVSLLRVYRTAFLRELRHAAPPTPESPLLLLAALRRRAKILEVPVRFDSTRPAWSYNAIAGFIRCAWFTVKLAWSQLFVFVPATERTQ